MSPSSEVHVNDYRDPLKRQCGKRDSDVRLVDAIRSAGVNVHELSLDDLFLFDQLCAGGAVATRALANMAGPTPGIGALDAGSGVS